MNESADVKVRGVSGFFYAGIPWVLAMGALAWIGVASGIVEFKHHLTLSERMDGRTGVTAPLIAPVKLVIKAPLDCMDITRAYMDGDKVTMYIRNRSCTDDGSLSYAEWGYFAKSPDGTIVASNFENTVSRPPRGETVEKTMEIKDDDRISEIEVYAK